MRGFISRTFHPQQRMPLKERAFLALKARVSECHELMNAVDKLFKDIIADFGLSGESSQVPEMTN